MDEDKDGGGREGRGRMMGCGRGVRKRCKE